MSLARYGARRLRCFDFDRVGEENIGTQSFDLRHIGQQKVRALADMLSDIRDDHLVGVQSAFSAVPRRCTGEERFSQVVFLCVDKLSERRRIFRGIVAAGEVSFLVDCRITPHYGEVYAFDPRDSVAAAAYEATLVADDLASPHTCSSERLVGPIADLAAGYAIEQFLRYYQKTVRFEGAVPSGVIRIILRPKMMVISSTLV